MTTKTTLAERAEAAGLSETEVSNLRDLEAEQRMAGTETVEVEPAKEVEAAKEEVEEAKVEPTEVKAEEPAEEVKAEEPEVEVKRVAPVVPTLAVDSIEGIDARLKEIRTELVGARKKTAEFEMEAADLAALEDRLDDERMSLISKRTKAEVKQETNDANLQAAFQTALRYFIRDAKREGIDYGNKYVLAMFNTAYADVLELPEHKSKGIEDVDSVFQAAHDIVKAQLGPREAPKATKPAETKPTEPKVTPKTLAELPAAAQAVTGDDIMDKINTLNGEDLEVFLAKLPKAKREELRRRAQ